MVTQFIVVQGGGVNGRWRLPQRDPVNHPKEDWAAPDEKRWHAELRDAEDTGVDSDPLVSRHDSRKAGLERKQRRYFKRLSAVHTSDLVTWRNTRGPSGKLGTHRMLTCHEDLWWKRKKIREPPTHQKKKQVHKVVRKGRIARKEAARREDGDYMAGMWGRDRGQSRCRTRGKIC